MSENLFNVGQPEIIEELDYEVILARMVAKAVELFAAAGINYDVGNLETDPVKIILESNAYDELNLRARANDVARAQILSFARRGDLDALAAFYGVTRLTDEGCDRLRERVREAIAGRSPAGPRHWYRYHALSADVRVRDVSVRLDPKAPKLLMTILSKDNGGVADQALLDTVAAALNTNEVRAVSDNLAVEAAVFDTVDIEANITLLEDQAVSLLDEIEENLQVQWDAVQAIGLDLTRSWLTKTLHTAGVHSVEIVSPSADIDVIENRAVSLGTITLNFAGYGY